MKAVIHERYGPPAVMRIADVAKPRPKADEILVKVHATTVNRSDCGFRSADPFIVRFFSGLIRPRHPISGTEFAGRIEAIGSNVRSFQVGDPVFGRAQDETPGAHAEYLCIRESGAVAAKPENLTYAQAAAVCDGAMLAGLYLRLVDIDPGCRILVNGASGAIGSAGVQLAKARGAEVTAVCKTAAIDIVRRLGADHIIDYTKQDFTELDQTFDVVFDAVGKSTLGHCKRLLRNGGFYFSSELGPLCQNPLLALRTAIFGGKIKVHFPIPFYRKQEVLFLKALAEAGQFAPVIDRTYPLEQIVDAATYVETGEKIGNVVIVVVADQD